MTYDSTSLPQSNDPAEIQKMGLDLLDKINKTHDAIPGAPTIPVITKEIVYTPTFLNLGVVTNVNMTYTMVGNRCKVMGYFLVGVGVVGSCSFSLPNGGVVDPALWTTTGNAQVVGTIIYNQVSASILYALGYANNGNIFIGNQSAGSTAFTPINGNAIGGFVLSVQIEVPLKGFNS